MVEPSRFSFFAEAFGVFSSFLVSVLVAAGLRRNPPPAWRRALRPEGGRRPRVLAAGGRRPRSAAGSPPSAPAPSAPPPSGSPPSGSPPAPPRSPDDAPLALAPTLAQIDRATAKAAMSFYPLVLRWVLRFGVPARDAPDVAQEALLGALPSWDAFVPWPGVLEGVARRHWLAGVAARQASGYRRRGREVPAAPEEIEDIPDGAALADEAIGARERATDVALNELEKATTPPRWAVFLAFEVEGRSLLTIAAIEGVPVGTIGSRLRLARADLRAAIERKRAQRTNEEHRAAMRGKNR